MLFAPTVPYLDTSACDQAAATGQLELLQQLYQQGAPWCADTSRVAATAGHLTIIQYLHEHGCPWDEDACYGAEKGDHMNVLQYMSTHEHPWSEVYMQRITWKRTRIGLV
jgi:hypothetical protein